MSIHVLVVDDEPDVVELFRQRLRRELRSGEWRLEFAHSGEEALRSLGDTGAEPPVVVLCDVNMPGMSGYQVLERALGTWPALPIVMVTAYCDDASRARALHGGARALFAKPIDFAALKTRVAELAAGAGDPPAGGGGA